MTEFMKKYKGELIAIGVCYLAALKLVREATHKTVTVYVKEV